MYAYVSTIYNSAAATLQQVFSLFSKESKYVPTAIRAGPVGIGGWGLGFKQVSVVLFKRFQRGPDICLLVLAGAECVNIQQGGIRLRVAAIGGGNGVPDASMSAKGFFAASISRPFSSMMASMISFGRAWSPTLKFCKNSRFMVCSPHATL